MEAPHLKAMHEKYGPKGLKILAVNAWDEPREKVASFVSSAQLPYTVLMNGRQVFREKYGGKTIPRNFLINSDGEIVLDQDGFDESALTTALNSLLQ